MKESRSLKGLQTAGMCAFVLVVLAATAFGQSYSSFVELRVYPIREAQQHRFLEFFEEHYLESQEVVGMRIWGQFRDLDAPNRFVWLRGYRSMKERLAGLQQFYGSPLWAETGGAAVSMLSGRAQHVHFLEPVSKQDAFASQLSRPLLVSEVPAERSRGVLVAEVFQAEEGPAEVADAVRRSVVPRLESAGGVVLGLFQSSDKANNFPLLPFIENEVVVVLFASFGSREQYAKAVGTSDSEPSRLETFVLEPGRRSRLYHRMDP